MVKLNSAQDITSKHHFLLLIFKTQTHHIDGDERSRSNPGHGYPAHDEVITATEIYAFEDQQDLEAKLVNLYEEKRDRKDIVVINVACVFEVRSAIKVELR